MEGSGQMMIFGRKVRLRRLTRVDVGFLHFKLALAVMLSSPLWQNPTMQKSLTGQLLTTWVLITAVGLIVSVVGLVMGAQSNDLRAKGFKIELMGLWLLMAGPLVFLAVQLGVWVSTGENKALAVLFPYVIMAAILARMQMVKGAMKTVLYKFPGERDDD